MYLYNSATDKKLAEMWKKLREDPIDPTTALAALNIPRLGWKSANKLSGSQGFDPIINFSLNKCNSVPDLFYVLGDIVGDATARSIIGNIYKLSRLQLIKDRIKFNNDNKENPELKGEVVITGKLNTCKRSEFEKIIIDAGYSLAPAVKKGVLYLITNTPDSGSSKNRKADELGIKKITEEEFLEMIK